MKRCVWAEQKDMHEYHDTEWGVPVHDDRVLFEFLLLEGVQAGLSWSTVLKKRANYRKVFDGFDPKKVAAYDDKKVAELLNNPGIIRNKLKVRSAIRNAKAFLAIQEKFGSFDKYMWSFVENKPIVNEFRNADEVPARTELSDKISNDLKKRGMSFVGSTIIYAFMQATGLVNDHETCCPRWKTCQNYS